jgi:hypothetical protein
MPEATASIQTAFKGAWPEGAVPAFQGLKPLLLAELCILQGDGRLGLVQISLNRGYCANH